MSNEQMKADFELILEKAEKADEAQRELSETKKMFADRHRRYRNGDHVSGNGFSQNGKVFVVDKCFVNKSYQGWYLVYQGFVLKADLKPGVQRTERREPIK